MTDFLRGLIKIRGFLWLPAALLLSGPVYPQRQSPASSMAAADHFLRLLTDALRAEATYPFKGEERYNWYFVPRPRKGVALKQLNPAQRQAALALLQTGLSEQGYAKATGIVDLESVLRELENRGPDDTYRDPGSYYFTVFGQPSSDEPWGWRMEGHHLSLNFSSVTGQLVSGTPMFMGSNPGMVPNGPRKGQQLLRQEADLAYALLQSCTPEQRKKVIIQAEAPADILTGNQRKAVLEKPVGLSVGEMNAEQQQVFRQLLNAYLQNYHKPLANYQFGKLERAGFSQLHFAWAGSTDRRSGHYYRIQGPTLLIEYDNTQNNANHVHTVVRDLTNDFGEDALQEHYRRYPHQK